jgi:hypothetical protein
MTIYYRITPNTFYLGSDFDLGKEESIELFYKLKKPAENIYSGIINTDLITKYNFIRNISDYLRGRKFLESFHPSETYAPGEYQFPKCCWLADSIITNGVIDPLSVHYNPRLQQNVVHPGQSRSYIAHLFQQDKTKCLYFNTSGVRFSWMKHFTVVDKESLLTLQPSYFAVAADHGSLIPHVYFGNQQDTVFEVVKYHQVIKNRLSNIRFRINSNVYIKPLEYWMTDSANAHIEINLKDHKSEDDIVRACILAVLGRPYKSDTLEVKVNPL